MEREKKGGWRGPGRDMLEVAYRLAADLANDWTSAAWAERARAHQRAAELAPLVQTVAR